MTPPRWPPSAWRWTSPPCSPQPRRPAWRRPPGPPPACTAGLLAGPDDWEQLDALRRAGQDAPDDEAARLFRRRRIAENQALTAAGHGTWFGAFLDGRLVSSLGVVSDGHGYARYQDVDTHPEHRRRGLARRLLHQAGRHAATTLGAHTLVIVADPDYHALELYRSVGFTVTEKQVQLESS